MVGLITGNDETADYRKWMYLKGIHEKVVIKGGRKQ